jgi:sugar lactone lactonase YvrE
MKLRSYVLWLAFASIARLHGQTYTFSSTNNFQSLAGIVFDSAGNGYCTTSYTHTVSKLARDGTMTNFVGLNNSAGSADGNGTAARFNSPRGIAIDHKGNLFVADSGNHTIRKITPGGDVTTFAGVAGQPGTANGTGGAAQFASPSGMTIDANDNLYVADAANDTIRKITPAAVVSTVAGSPRQSGSTDGAGSDARFTGPQDIAIDSAGNLFVADSGNHTIRKITPAGVVTTFGSAGNAGNLDAAGSLARFQFPQALTVDRSDNVLVCDTANYVIRKITSDGMVKTIGGQQLMPGNAVGTGANARFYGPHCIAVDNTGTVYVGDSYGLKLAVTSDDVAITVAPQSSNVAAGSTAVLSVTATGAGPITYRWQKDGVAIPGATSAQYLISNVQTAHAGAYSVTVSNPVGSVTSANATLTVLSPLANDNFANATVLSGASGAISGSNNGATAESGEPTHSIYAATLSSVWYKWTAPQSGTVTFTITGNGPALAGAAYTGSTMATLKRIASVMGSRLSITADAGTTYYIAIGTYNSTRGAFSLNWQTLVNDSFAGAQVISGTSGKAVNTNDGATNEPGEPIHWPGSSASSSSIWYRWTPAQDGVAIFDTLGTSITTVVAVYTGTQVDQLTLVGANVLYGSSGRLVLNVSAGTTYSIAVGTYSYGTGVITLNWQLSALPVITTQPIGVVATAGIATSLKAQAVSAGIPSYTWYKDGAAIPGGSDGTLTLSNPTATDAGNYNVVIANQAGSVTSTTVTLTVLIPPPNDNFANAAVISGDSGNVKGSNVNATGEANEPIHWNTIGTATGVWYRWTASTNGLAVIDTVGSNFDTVLAVYTGTSLSTLARLTQDDERGGGHTSLVSFAARAGVTYSVAVGSGTNVRGNITLNWQLSPTLAIATPPISQTVTAGGSATFSVQATGAGLTYQWLRNGTPIPGATSSTLTIGNIQGGGDANYTVQVSNSSGSVTSAPATLAVAAPMLTNLTSRNVRAGGGLLWSIAGGNGTLVTVGSAGEILSSSDNGQTWVPRNSGNNLWLVAVTYGAGQFVIVGEAGTILTSPDGVTWTPAKSPGTTERINNVIYVDGKFVAVGEHGVILTSPDAQTWTVRSSGIKTWLHGLAYNARIGYFATDGENGVILYSPDAVTWNSLPVDGLTSHLEAVVAGGSDAEFVAVGHEGVCVAIHQNQLRLKTGETLTTWTTDLNPTGTTEGFVGLTSGAGALFATGTSGKIISAKDSRGPWYTVPSGTNQILLGATFYNDTLYVVGSDETILQSDTLYNSRLINISTRGQVGTGSNVLISGFVVRGAKPKQVLIRAAGPALAADPFNIAGVLAQPVLTLVNADQKTVAANTGWANSANADALATVMAQVGAFPFSRSSADSAILVTLDPGTYTAVVSGVNNGTGVAIVEVYDADPMSNQTSNAINISTRGLTGSGSNVMIAGFVVNGAASRRVLLRAVGPTLANFNITGTAAEPQLLLYNSHNLLTASASAWGLQSNADEIRSAADAVGAFALPEGSKDSAMVVTLLPGTWTVQVQVPEGTNGVAMIELYALP